MPGGVAPGPFENDDLALTAPARRAIGHRTEIAEEELWPPCHERADTWACAERLSSHEMQYQARQQVKATQREAERRADDRPRAGR
mmetsp:Transcript_16088/g.56038  ORF Transcript_16088/g.56038 Transcript_16088/m.56038 type:complete len:86 (+) Transcript_16088:778-1035(+)